QAIITLCNSPEYAHLPPSQIVPRLADQGCYLASEATFYRVLRAAGQQQRRGRSQRPRRYAAPTTHAAKAPNQVWSWDISHIRTQSHDYIRHGTVTLFTALDYLEGKLISSIERQHRHQEWLDFLKKINRETPKHLQLHLIVDNYATHKHPKVKAWLEKHKRFHMHFTPTSSSWMNMVERFFRDITVYLRDGSFSSIRELESSITTFLALRNAQPTRYVWNAKGEDILNKIQRARVAMSTQA
ncbi:IS630 family transposase, partial [Pseudomonas syringae]|uniref:IS630 family transposase n=1 Tax=Pseudomonas syringae TaxID=317 RepID=UPI001EED4363